MYDDETFMSPGTLFIWKCDAEAFSISCLLLLHIKNVTFYVWGTHVQAINTQQ